MPAAGADPFVSRGAALQGGLGATAFLGRRARASRPSAGTVRRPRRAFALRDDCLAQRGGAFVCVIDACLAQRGLRKERPSELFAAPLSRGKSLENGGSLVGFSERNWKEPVVRNAPANAFAARQSAGEGKLRSVWRLLGLLGLNENAVRFSEFGIRCEALDVVL